MGTRFIVGGDNAIHIDFSLIFIFVYYFWFIFWASISLLSHPSAVCLCVCLMYVNTTYARRRGPISMKNAVFTGTVV